MQDMDMVYTPVAQLRQLLDCRQVSSAELTEVYLRRISSLNPRLTFLRLLRKRPCLGPDQQMRDRQTSKPFLGIPICIKDLEATKGIRTTLGSLVFRDTVPDVDSVVAERVRASGAVLLGKTNTPEFGLLGTTENRLGDPCRNPWNLERTSGGSSGGAGAAVAAGMCPIATGSDGGGSIRNPSSFCGLFGIKPTLGRVPRAGGLGRPAPNLTSQPGPIARTVRDAAMLLQVLAGHDARDPMSLRDRPLDYLANLDDGVRGLRIAWSPDLGYATIDPEVVAVTAKAARIFEELGCSVDQPPFQLDDPITAFRTIFYTNNFASYGHLLKERPGELTDNSRLCLEQGSQTAGIHYADALREVEVVRARVENVMESYDLLLSPTMAVPPFPIGQPPQRIGGEEVQASSSYSPLTRPFNLTGHPAASIPCGFSSEGLPIGLHIIGRLGDEATVLRASAAFEQARPWAQHRPAVD